MKRDLILLCISVLIFYIGVGASTPIIPLYARYLGATYADLGLMGLAYSITFMALAIPSGRFSDLIGRRKALIISTALCGLLSIMYILAKKVSILILIRTIEGMAFSIFWTSLDAFSTEILSSDMAGRSMGIVTASYGVGYITGSFVGGYTTLTMSFEAVFLLYFVSSLASVVMLIPVESGRERKETEALSFSGLNLRHMAVAGAVATLYCVAFIVFLTLFPAYAEDLGANPFLVGVLSAAFWIGRLTAFPLTGYLSDKIGRGETLSPVLMLGAVFSMIIAFYTDFRLLMISSLMIGVAVGAAFPVTVAFISDYAPESRKGVAMGFFETSCGFGMIVGSILGGFLAQNFGANTPYIMCGCALALASVITGMYVVKMRRKM